MILPYYVKGKDLYLNFYGDKDHKEIAEQINKVSSQKWIVTYDNVDQIKNLYPQYRQKEYSLNYSAGQANTGKEVMIFSNNLYISKNSLLP